MKSIVLLIVLAAGIAFAAVLGIQGSENQSVYAQGSIEEIKLDFSDISFIDPSQSTIKIEKDRALTADGALSSRFMTNTLFISKTNIVEVKFDADDKVRGNTSIDYFISNNNGQSWVLAKKESFVKFSNTGRELKLMGVISRKKEKNTSAWIKKIELTVQEEAFSPESTVSREGRNGQVSLSGQNTSVFSRGARTSSAQAFEGDPRPVVNSVLSRLYFPGGQSIFSTFDKLSGVSARNSIFVRAPSTGSGQVNGQVYEIINGQRRHVINEDVLFSYGVGFENVRKITSAELNRYPRAKFLVFEDKLYYLTEAGYIRWIPDLGIFSSYGLKAIDAIFINEVEFNLYPKNQYIFDETGKDNRIWFIDGDIKRPISKEAIARLRISNQAIAPVNRTEFDFYREVGQEIK